MPDIWRTELWHPMIVHFPIVLLLGATLLRILSHLISGENRSFLKKTSRLSLWLGVVTAWLAIYTGTLADSIVVRNLCDPTVLEDHENAAYTIGAIFTVAVVVDLIAESLLNQNAFIKKITEWGLILLLVTGSGYIGYASHLGATLVYQQGAAVYIPSEGCTEFE